MQIEIIYPAETRHQRPVKRVSHIVKTSNVKEALDIGYADFQNDNPNKHFVNFNKMRSLTTGDLIRIVDTNQFFICEESAPEPWAEVTPQYAEYYLSKVVTARDSFMGLAFLVQHGILETPKKPGK